MSLIAGLFVLCTYGFTYTGANPAKAFGPALVYIVIGEYVLLVQFVVLCLADFLGAIIAFFVIKKFASKRMTKNIDQITNKHIIENNIQDANSNSANNNQEESNF